MLILILLITYFYIVPLPRKILGPRVHPLAEAFEKKLFGVAFNK